LAITNAPNVYLENPYPLGGLDTSNQGFITTKPEAASQTFVRGDLVTLASGKVTEVTNAITGGADIFAIALEDSTGTTDTPIKIFVLNPDALVVMGLADLSAVDTGNYLEPGVAHIGAKVSVVKETSTGKWVANVNAEGTVKSFIVVDSIPFRLQDKFNTAASAYGARVVCRMLIAGTLDSA
jgi:hypothetical protein